MYLPTTAYVDLCEPHRMVIMSIAAESGCNQSVVSSVEKISFNLSSDPNGRAFSCTLRWIIFKIVEANDNITYVNLKKILRGEFGIDKQYLDTAISSLTSPMLLDGLSKWRNPRMKDVGPEIGIHLFARNESEVFKDWKATTLQEFPELESFTPPVATVCRTRNKASK